MKNNSGIVSGTCTQCGHRRRYPKYSCKDCAYAFTSNFKLDREFNPKCIKKARIKESDFRLRELYDRIKAKYFGDNYLPKGKEVLFTYKCGKASQGGWCNKTHKEIRIGGIYRYAFIRKTRSAENMWCSEDFNDVKRRDLVDLFIHEALHLRMAHHRKSFRLREKEFKSKVRDEDIKELYMDLI